MCTTGSEVNSSSDICDAPRSEAGQLTHRNTSSINSGTHIGCDREQTEGQSIPDLLLQPTDNRSAHIEKVEQNVRSSDAVESNPKGSTRSPIFAEHPTTEKTSAPICKLRNKTNLNTTTHLSAIEYITSGSSNGEKSTSQKSNGDRYGKISMKKSAERRRRIDNRKQGTNSFSWILNKPEHGYIRHPDAKLLIHPSFFREDGFELCAYNDRCTHERNCGETRIRMAAMSYLRNKNTTTYRDLELIWGVSRSTIQRKTNDIQSKKQSDLIFLLNP